MHRECDGTNGDRQKKGVGSTVEVNKKGEDTSSGAPSGWLKIDSAILQKPTTVDSASKVEEDFVDEDVDIDAEVERKKGVDVAPALMPPAGEFSNPSHIPSEPT